jgi:phenylalanyl-tRNA synthetase alpha chain
MYNDKLLNQLHDHEKKILKALEEVKVASVKELEGLTGLVKDSIEKASLWAKVKGVISIREDKTEFIELTKEGLEYAKDALPERKLITLVNESERKIDELRKKLNRFSIGLVWVKRNDWVEINNGLISITERGKKILEGKIPEEKILSTLSNGKKLSNEFDPKFVEKLEKRGLVRKRIETHKYISLTDLGREILPKIKLNEEIGQLKPETIISKEWKEKPLRGYDITLPVSRTYPGKKHYMTQLIEYIRQIWLEMGFKEMTGPILEVSFWNFDALYVPADHPARDLADTFYMKVPESGKLPEKEIVENVQKTHEYGWTCNSTGWQYKWDPELAKQCILRTHTTSLSTRTLAKLREDIDKDVLPAKYFSVGRCFRNETLDWQHLVEFYQSDGIVVGENVNFRHLLGYLKRFFTKLGFPKARFRPSYFPYTEPSTEIEVFHPVHKKWIELGGAGIFRPEVVKPLLGKDIPVLAWGPGFERLVMINYEIEDIRTLYWNDLDQLRKARIWVK